MRPVLTCQTDQYRVEVHAGWQRVCVRGTELAMQGVPRLDDPEQRRMARDLGYGDNDLAVLVMGVEHDALHAWCSMWWGSSAVIDHQAGFAATPESDRVQEEAVVLAFQKTLNDCPNSALTKAFRAWLWQGQDPAKVVA